jgi:hypothetical protein
MDNTLDTRGPRRPFPWRALVWGTAAAIMLLAACAKLFVPGFLWTPGDFLAMGILLVVPSLCFEVALRMARNDNFYLLGAALGIGACFLLVYFNLAVGIIGGEDDPANVVFLWVIGTALATSLLARLRPAGVAIAMVVTALVQAGVAVYAWTLGSPEGTILSAAFAGVFLAAAACFRHAARHRAP